MDPPWPETAAREECAKSLKGRTSTLATPAGAASTSARRTRRAPPRTRLPCRDPSQSALAAPPTPRPPQVLPQHPQLEGTPSQRARSGSRARPRLELDRDGARLGWRDDRGRHRGLLLDVGPEGGAWPILKRAERLAPEVAVVAGNHALRHCHRGCQAHRAVLISAVRLSRWGRIIGRSTIELCCCQIRKFAFWTRFRHVPKGQPKVRSAPGGLGVAAV